MALSFDTFPYQFQVYENGHWRAQLAYEFLADALRVADSTMARPCGNWTFVRLVNGKTGMVLRGWHKQVLYIKWLDVL